MFKHATLALVGLALIRLDVAASADSGSLFTVALGTSVGVSRTGDLRADAHESVSPSVDLRLRLFRVMGLDIGYSPLTSNDPSSTLVYQGPLSLSAVLYLVPLSSFGLYAKAGVSGADPKDLFTLTADANAYHGGGGLEVYLGEHFAVGAEFLVLLPGLRSVEKALVADALRRSALRETSGAAAAADKPLEVGDFVHGGNFKTSLSLRYFF